MTRKRRAFVRTPSPAMVVALVALLLAAAGVSFAAIPGSNGSINGCYTTKDGRLRVIDTEQGQSCKSNEIGISFAATDVNGKVADADKLDGMDSTDFLGAIADAADSASTITRTTFATLQLDPRGTPPPGQSSAALTKSCNAGEVATGGGGSANGDHTLAFTAPTPQTDGSTPTGWTIVVENRTASTSTAIDGVWVVCAPAP